MLEGASLVAFLATRDADAARRFYSQVLGLTLVEDTPFTLVFQCNGNMLRIQKVGQVSVAPYTALGWSVPDMDAAVRALVSRGVVLKRFPGMDQDPDGVWRAPGGARVAWFADPDGNTLSLTQL